MKKFLTQIALGAAALFNLAAANAAVMDFDTGVDYSNAPFAAYGGLLASGDYLVQGNYFAQTLDALGQIDPSSLGGNVSNASDPSTCLNACPSNSSTHGNFLSVYDDAQVHFGTMDGSTLLMNSLSAAFITSSTAPANSTIYLAVEADVYSGGALESYSAYGWLLGTSGAFQTVDVNTSGAYLYSSSPSASFTQGITDYFVFGYFCNGKTGSCSAFNTDASQFSLDDVNFAAAAAVPEPSEWLLMCLGLAAVGAAARRRRSI